MKVEFLRLEKTLDFFVEIHGLFILVVSRY